MRRLSKAWLFLICLASYLSMGQAGCQTTSSSDLAYIRSDLVRIKRDVDDIKKQLGTPLPSEYGDVLRNQAAQREMLLEVQEGQQRAESRLEENRYELRALRQEMTNLKLNLVNQMEAIRAASKGSGVSVRSPDPTPPASVPPAQPSAASGVPPFEGPEQPAPPVEPTTPPLMSPPAVAPAPSAVPPMPGPAEPIDYTKLYDQAYEDYVRQSYSLARSGFGEYLRRFPDTDLADNAQYWIGECYYAEGRYEEAAKAFQQVITRYPTGNKVPRAMLKAGYALMQLGRDQEARDIFQQVVDAYPLSSEADQAKSKLKSLQ